jgi:HD-GYP domain-containing protein (c-di-GMP phosphodiesterase class II)
MLNKKHETSDQWGYMHRLITRRHTLIRICANFTGACVCTSYFIFFDPTFAAHFRYHTIAVSIAMFIAFSFIGNYFLFVWERDIARFLRNKQQNQKIGPHMQARAQRKVINIPFVSALTNLVNWIAAALCLTGYAIWIYAAKLQQPGFATIVNSAKVFIGVSLSGLVACAIIFLSMEYLCRDIWTFFFPKGGFSGEQRVIRVKLKLRLLIVFTLTSILPMLLMAVLSYNKAKMMLSDNPEEVLKSMFFLTGFLIVVELSIIFTLSHLFSTSILNPIEDMVSAMNRVKKGDFSASVKVYSNNELGFLGDCFNDMVQKIDVLNSNLKKNALQTVLGIAKALGARDKYTEGHAQRVAVYAQRLARRLGLSEEEAENIGIGGTLHDIGKIGFSDRIFSTEDATFSGEMIHEIKLHPEIGATIIKNMEFLGPVFEYVLCHHEHIDGNGYPQGLKDHEIPIGSKIISVADCFDAITTDRAYQKGRSTGDAFKILREIKGESLDARLVEMFIAEIEENGL